MQIDPIEKRELLKAVDTVRAFIERLETTRACISCINWKDGCKLAGGQQPPEQVKRNGCDAWVIWDEIPYM